MPSIEEIREATKMEKIEKIQETTKLLDEALDKAVSQLKILRQARELYASKELKMDSIPEYGCPIWPAEIKTIYYILDPECDPRFLEKGPNVAKSKYFKLISFLEECARRGAIVYRRQEFHFSWAVTNQEIYWTIYKDYGYGKIEFEKWERGRGHVI